MTRDLLNSGSDWVLAVLFIAVTVIVTLVGWLLARRFLSRWLDPESSDKVVGVAAMVMTLFALVLAFVIVNLYNTYESAAANVTSEANSLRELLQDARAFPTPEQQAIRRSVARYVTEVRGHEFPMLRDGHEDPRGQDVLYGIFGALQRYSPRTTAQTTFYRSAAEQLNTIVTERNNRIDAAEATIPAPLLALTVLLALLTLFTTILIRTHHIGTDLALILSVAVVVGAGVFTAAILEYPFSGSIAITSAPFERGTLAR